MSKDAAAEQGDLSAVTWTRVETGQTVRPLTYVGIDHALDWVSGSCSRFLATGESPALKSEASKAEWDALMNGMKPSVAPVPDPVSFVADATSPALSDLDDAELERKIREGLDAMDEMRRRRG